MTAQTNTRERVGKIGKTKALAAGLLVAAMMAAGILAASPSHAATTFTVNSTADAPDAFTTSNTCDTDVFTGGDQCSLRAAIQQANATAGADTINFAIPGTGVKTIAVGATGLGTLPTITDPVSISGYTQTGASPNTLGTGNNAVLKIELSGNGATGTGLGITAVNGVSVIKGLAINRFGEGIDIFGDTVGNRIEGNYIGTDKSGTKSLPNGDGFFGCSAVLITDSFGNTVGGTTGGARNLISANASDGVGIFGDSQNNKVLGNRIGITANGTGALGNGEAGVLVQGFNNLVGDGTSAGSNTIAFNGEDGVQVQSGARNAISRNSIFSNAFLGIDLQGGFEDAQGNTANDPGDVDSGPNGLQNKPLITSAKTSSTKTTITGKLQSRPNSGYTIEFFSNPSGNEGKKYLGEKSIVNTDPSGNASFTFSTSTRVAVGQTITAMARSVNLDASFGDTSEFSAPKSVGKASLSALSPETTKLSGPSGSTNSPTAHFKFASPNPEATFECSLDGGAYYECSSPENINLLSDGRHIFLVRAIDAEGSADASPAEWVWAVDRRK